MKRGALYRPRTTTEKEGEMADAAYDYDQASELLERIELLLFALKDCRNAYLKSSSDEVAELFNIDLINDAIDKVEGR
jgi:hypothetical protein